MKESAKRSWCNKFAAVTRIEWVVHCCKCLSDWAMLCAWRAAFWNCVATPFAVIKRRWRALFVNTAMGSSLGVCNRRLRWTIRTAARTGQNFMWVCRPKSISSPLSPFFCFLHLIRTYDASLGAGDCHVTLVGVKKDEIAENECFWGRIWPYFYSLVFCTRNLAPFTLPCAGVPAKDCPV